jgi:monovalent cation:H+ antiporter-2, CPA2 family
MDHGFFIQAIVYLSAAVICVPIAKRLGLSSILGYLFAGIVIGPFVLGFVGKEGEDIMHFAEFGVVMMLFLIGLELDPYKFWRMRKFILGMGSLQVVGTTLILFWLGHSLLDWSWQTAMVVAMALSLSSTAIVLQTLKEKGLSKTSVGRSSFAVLLFQDIAVIPILAVIPLMVTSQVVLSDEDLHNSLVADLPAWLQTLAVIGTIVMVFFIGRFAIIPLLRIIARTRLQELFTASALLLVLGVSYIMELVGLSPALGAFMAGVVLANSEFSHELEGDIAPFKGLLLGLFFIGVGASINFRLIIENPNFIFSVVLILTFVKFLILSIIGKIYQKKTDENLLFSFGLCQAGEFGFVIMSFAMQLNIIPNILGNQVMAVVALSMLTTPFLLVLNEKWITPAFGYSKKEKKNKKKFNEVIDEKNEVIIAGFGHFGSTIGRLLRASGIEATILDHDAERVEVLRNMGFKVYYGDATRLELLKAAGTDQAKLFITAIDNPEANLKTVKLLRKHYPNLKILTRARSRTDAYELLDKGIDNVYRETLYTAVHLGVDALAELGYRKYTATRIGQQFIKYDQISIKRLAAKRHDKMAYMVSTKEEIELQEEILRNDRYSNFATSDHAWDSEHLKKN